MQFVKDGPDVPDGLIEAHEDGRVVFFCGAGISYPAGLPGFDGLVTGIFTELGATRDSIEDESFNAKRYDATLDALERRFPGHRTAVRKAIPSVLKPRLRLKGAADTHTALLRLSASPSGALRLVTTNFDRIFVHAARKAKISLQSHCAPFLPIPKSSKWDGLVYLHGFLPAKPTDLDLQRLVMTSGDFGLAYLTERWAARFVSELFRNYVVCFAGYSINDPVLRYMMDALAADRLQGEAMPQSYAFADYAPSQKDKSEREWRAKGVVPVLYLNSSKHAAFHKTLQAWSATYSLGTLGRENIVTTYAGAKPLASTVEDDFVGRMLWAISHSSGAPAKRFADLDPVPSLDWLEPLSDQRFKHADLNRFGVPPHAKVNDKLAFSVVERPTPYSLAPRMALFDGYPTPSGWDSVMWQLWRWLCRHLDDPSLIWRFGGGSGTLPSAFAQLLINRLSEIDRLKQSGQEEAFRELLRATPRGIPRPAMRRLWNLFICSRVKSSTRDRNLYDWVNRFKAQGLTNSLKLELRELLRPCISMRRPYVDRLPDSEAWSEDARVSQLVTWELKVEADYAKDALKELKDDPLWKSAQSSLLEEFDRLLSDALDLLSELDGADDKGDRSHWDMPSISPHFQNRGFRDWTVLIELLRDAWSVAYEQGDSRSLTLGDEWWKRKFPLFKRLALYTRTFEFTDASGTWVDWLTKPNSWWLWSIETQREVMRLLALRGSALPPDQLDKLLVAITAGPPREMYVDDLAEDRWKFIQDHGTWIRLAKLKLGGTELGVTAQEVLSALEGSNSSWQLAANERDEFSHWMSGTGDPDFEDQHRAFERAPREMADLMRWLNEPSSEDFWYRDDWRELCKSEFELAAKALVGLAKQNNWPQAAWREALQTWADDTQIKLSWRYLAPVVALMPAETMREIAHSVSWWLETASKAHTGHSTAFESLCRRLVGIEHQDGMQTEKPVSRAINHPIGHVAQAVLNQWTKSRPQDGIGIPANVKQLFNQFLDSDISQFRHARVILCAHVILTC